MQLPQLPTHTHCALCSRSTGGCRSVGIATAHYAPSLPPSASTPAIVFVAAFPSYNEDIHNAPFVGPAGNLLRTAYIEAPRFHTRASIYLTNALRCYAPADPTPKKRELKACLSHMLTDLRAINATCSHIHLVLMGAPTVSQHGFTSLTASFRSNGQPFALADIPASRITLYTTYNPAVLLSRATPAKARSVSQHIQLLEDHLNGKSQSPAEPTLVEPRNPRQEDPSFISLDIETFGACRENIHGNLLELQHYFHPRPYTIAGRPRRTDLVATTAITLVHQQPQPRPSRNDERQRKETPLNQSVERQLYGGETFVLVNSNARHRQILSRWIKHARAILGHNISFDISWLRESSPLLRRLLHLRSHLLIDTSVYRYLYNESADELSLKELGPLFSLFTYTDEETLQKGHRFPSPLDPLLALYNARDSHRTLILYNHLLSLIARAYPSSSKLSLATQSHYSDLLWLGVEMSSNGVCFDDTSLRTAINTLTRQRTALRRRLNKHFHVIVEGKGSMSMDNPRSRYNFINDLIERHAPDLLKDKNLKRTKTRSLISYGRENRQLLFSTLSINSPARPPLTLFHLHSSISKLIDSYYTPLLRKTPHASPFTLIANPTWFICPGRVNDDQGSAGGTEQARITCKDPAIQTFPPSIKSAIASRYTGGSILWADLSQIELRVTAILSGEPAMLDVYDDPSRNLHLETAALLYGPSVSKGTVEYKSGKESNFLINYRGGPATLQARILARTGVIVPLLECKRIVSTVRDSRPVLWAWQSQLIERVCRTKSMILEPFGQSRYFPGSPSSIRATYTTNICNLPIQLHASNTLLDIQLHLSTLLANYSPRILQIANVYDAVVLDCPPHLEPDARSFFDTAVRHCARTGYWAYLNTRSLPNRPPLPLAYEFDSYPSPIHTHPKGAP